MSGDFKCLTCGHTAAVDAYLDAGPRGVWRPSCPGDQHVCHVCGTVQIVTQDGYRLATEHDVRFWEPEARAQIAEWVRGAHAGQYVRGAQ